MDIIIVTSKDIFTTHNGKITSRTPLDEYMCEFFTQLIDHYSAHPKPVHSAFKNAMANRITKRMEVALG